MIQSRTNIIAANTLFLYLRSFLTIGIGLYASRLLLETLGVEDFGMYSVVGGVVAMFTSLRVVFASSVQRFLNYEKGKKEQGKPLVVFNLSILVHLLLALLFFVVVEILGLNWLLPQLNLPKGATDTSIFLFHFSLLTAVVHIIDTPFCAAIIANERIKVFAWLTLIDSILRCVAIFFLPLFNIQYVKLYAVIIFSIVLLNSIFNILYTRRFDECKFKICFDRSLLSEILSFSAWNFFGNTAFTLVNEGLNFILNIFGGVVVNAARGIAYQVKNSVNTLNNNLLVAVQPFIIQEAASQQIEVLFNRVYRISRLSYTVILLTTFPIIIEIKHILKIWLVEVPPFSDVFIQILFIHMIIRSLHNPLDLLFKTIGKIKVYQIVDSLTLALSLPASYMLLKMGYPFWSVFAVMCVVEVVDIVAIVFCAMKLLTFRIKEYILNVLMFVIRISIVFVIIGIVLHTFLPETINIIKLLFILSAIYMFECGIAYTTLCKEDKKLIHSIFQKIK